MSEDRTSGTNMAVRVMFTVNGYCQRCVELPVSLCVVGCLHAGGGG